MYLFLWMSRNYLLDVIYFVLISLLLRIKDIFSSYAIFSFKYLHASIEEELRKN